MIALVGAVILIFACLALIFAGIYRFGWKNPVLNSISSALPLPAVYVSGAGTIRISEIDEDVRAVKKFYETQDFEKLGMRVDFGTDQGEKRLKVKEKEIINKLIENKIIETLSQSKQIVISDATIDAEVDMNIEKFGNRQNLMSELSRLYGWTLEDFKQKVVKPELYAEKLAQSHAAETDTGKQQEKISALHERVVKKKEDFEKVAREASEGESAAQDGDLGWSAKDQLITEISEPAFSLDAGQISEVIASPLGFHVIKVEEKKTEGDMELVHLRQIFVKTDTFGDWLKNQMKDFRVVSLLEDYTWNAGEARMDFKNADLRQFEKNLEANSEGDPSVFP